VKSLRRHATVSGFLVDRVLRIFPVWLPIAVVLCIASALGGRAGFDASEPARWLMTTLGNVLLLPPLLPLPTVHPASWSLSYEWLFYAASAIAALLWRAKRSVLAAKLLWAAAVALLIACFPRALFFLPGVLVALAPERVRFLQLTPVLVAFTLPAFLLTWYSTGVFAAQFDKPLWSVVTAGHGAAVLVALLAATHVFACVAAPNARGLGLLVTRAAQHLGSISYSFYLVHPLAMAAVKPVVVKLLPDAQGSWSATFVFAVASALVAWGLSYLSWRWLEQRLARGLRSRTRPSRFPRTADAVVQGH